MTQFHSDADRFMRAALREAAKGLGRTSPNPTVGAVLVRDDKIIARAHHRQSGLPHAEVECLAKVTRASRERSTMYVTLEPCCTAGRTGPCTARIIEAGVKTVVVGAIDPNPLHRGRGIAELRNAGIEVRTGVLEAECAALNEAFNKWIVTGTPFVIAKCGMSLDGRLTRPPGEPKYLTSAKSRRHARALRAEVDAIIVGAETVRADDPRLTARDGQTGRQPLVIVLTRSGKLPKNARIFRQKTIVYRRKSLRSVLSDLGRKNITNVLIEGGGDVLGQALDSRLIDKIQIYLAPIFTGGQVPAFGGRGVPNTAAALHLERVSYSQIGHDICITGYKPCE